MRTTIRALKRAVRQTRSAISRPAPKRLVANPNAHPATQHLVEDHKAEGVPILDRRWYYTIETSPGVWTKGYRFANVGLTREALRRFEPRHKNCLDIGAMDGMIATLLYRRGAKSVIVYDRLNFSESMTFLKNALKVEFDYKWGDPFSDFQQKQLKDPLFDVVIFSGVMYHMVDPLGGLLRTRSLVRDGGIVIVETAAIQDKHHVSFFNAYGQFYDGDNYFFPSTALLDYWLRLARLEPLDCYWLPQPRSRGGFGKEPIRICVPCRAISTPLVEKGDIFMSKAAGKIDFAELCDFNRCREEGGLPIGYNDRGLPMHRTGGVDLFATVRKTTALHPPENLTKLSLSDVV